MSLTKESSTVSDRKLSFREHYDKPGVYILKDKTSNKIYTVGAGKCLYRSICHAIHCRTRIDLYQYAELGIIQSNKEFFSEVIETIRVLHRTAPVKATHALFQQSMNGNRPLPLDLLDFRDIYEPSNVRPMFTFRHMNIPGVYIIMENEKIVYVGLGTTRVGKALYQHFLRYRKDREGAHYRANYFLTRDAFLYKAAIIEIPWIGRSQGDISKDVSDLENYLILYFDPRDNVKGVISEDSIAVEVLADNWKALVVEGLSPEEIVF